jgi:hypothetical protein
MYFTKNIFLFENWKMQPRSRLTPTRMLRLHVVTLCSKVEWKKRRPAMIGETHKLHPSHGHQRIGSHRLLMCLRGHRLRKEWGGSDPPPAPHSPNGSPISSGAWSIRWAHSQSQILVC